MDLWMLALSLCMVSFFFCCCGGCNDGGVFGAVGDCCADLPANLDVTIPNVFTTTTGGCKNCPSIGGTYTLAPTGGNTTLSCAASSSGYGYGPGTEYSYLDDDFCLLGTAPFQSWYNLLITATFTCQSNVCYLIVVVTLYDRDTSCTIYNWSWVYQFSRGKACDTDSFTIPWGSANWVSGATVTSYDGDGLACGFDTTPGDVTAVGS